MRVRFGLVLVLAFAGCRLALYPAARMFGSPGEKELTACRKTFAGLKAAMPGARLTVHPPGVIAPRGERWSGPAAREIARRLRHGGLANVEVAPELPGVERAAPGPNQLRFTWKRARDFSAWVRSSRPGPGWHLFAEFIVAGDGTVIGIEYYVIAEDGSIAVASLINSHHAAMKRMPASPVEAGRLVAEGLLQALQRSPEELFPPYGVG